ncbi:purine-cytosine permease family protein [Rhizobium aegyptiacum]|uniref:purine-cytosine permease family protein n=1 Tax=Rhizobium aegyptiacum TaxID=1764550 RepID=UPI0007E5B609|nr:cytosine permease [Rhizobium aegyptiacum]
MEIEQRTIDFIPEAERYGKERDLFPVWFGANVNLTSLVTGALLISMGLNLFWAVFSIIVRVSIGTILVASHSVQGPRLGIPQMIQSRAQFGVLGAIFPMLFVMFIYFGFSVSNTLLAAQTVNGVVAVPRSVSIVVFTLLSFAIALYGYKLIHDTQRWLTWIACASYAVVFVIVLSNPPSLDYWLPVATKPALVFAGIGVTCTFALSFAPYVADYSRYLPSNVSSRKVFWYTFAGIAVALFAMMLLGALLAVQIPTFSDNSGGSLAMLFGSFSPILYVLIVYALLCINVFNFYGAFMAVVTTIQPFGNMRFGSTQRAVVMIAIAIANAVLSYFGDGDFSTMFLNFIFLMSYALIPWTAINLVDYYVLRRGQYSVADIFDPDGIYGRYNPIAIGAFVFAVLAEIPFISMYYYTGPVAAYLGNIDLAWIVGVPVGACLYYFPMRARLSQTGPVQTATR